MSKNTSSPQKKTVTTDNSPGKKATIADDKKDANKGPSVPGSGVPGSGLLS